MGENHRDNSDSEHDEHSESENEENDNTSSTRSSPRTPSPKTNSIRGEKQSTSSPQTSSPKKPGLKTGIKLPNVIPRSQSSPLGFSKVSLKCKKNNVISNYNNTG